MGAGDFSTGRLGCARSFTVEAMRLAVDTAFPYLKNTLREFRMEMFSLDKMPENEDGLTDILVVALNSSRRPSGLIFKAESRENRFGGNFPAVDIGIFWELPGRAVSSWPRISAIEAKRLDSRIDSRRHREYVYGHDERGRHVASGGIERYKKGLQGKDISTKSVMLGYMQTDDFTTWHKRINGWIAELAGEAGHEPAWSCDEELSSPVLETEGAAICNSIVVRSNDALPLLHLWVDLTTGEKDGGHA